MCTGISCCTGRAASAWTKRSFASLFTVPFGGCCMAWSRKLRAFALFSAVVLTAAGYFVSSGLEPVWWLVWVAPLPLLLVAPVVRGWEALGAAWIARSAAMLVFWQYWRGIMLPLWLSVAMVALAGACFALAVMAYRSFAVKGYAWLAALAFPVVSVAEEYLLSLWQGTFGNTGYTQLKNLPVLQLAAISGLWGIGFAVTLFGAVVAAVVHAAPRQRARLGIAFAAFYVCVFSFGELRLHKTPDALHSVVVGLVESHAGADMFPRDARSMMDLLQRYAGQAQVLADRGAQIVVLPEMTGLVVDPGMTNGLLKDQLLSPAADGVFEEAARRAHVQILLGVEHATERGSFNEGRLYSAAGTIETVYRKHHLVPVLEGRTSPGDGISVLSQPAGEIGIEICRDMDYPELARRYGHRQVGLILAPAWDQGVDALWHGHMSLMRAVEDGFTLVRDAKVGFLTASDDRGRILAEESAVGGNALHTMLVSVPVRHDATVYQAWGDWFAWVDLAGVMVLGWVGLREWGIGNRE
ncbi:hypothetical protein DYQ86_09460 [Acidobacteria bacterium AB60]|nr:hypothetical protein DYQ86_09460 [Acidobacteria bacterium AB60]